VTQVKGTCKNADKNKRKILGCHKSCYICKSPGMPRHVNW